jgi:hypothetical protein
MPPFTSIYGPWALVCGAADGLGAAYSRALARRGLHLIMVDIQGDKLAALRRELEQDQGVQTTGLELDLSHPAVAEQVFRAVDERDCRLLVYNAAYGPVKMFATNTSEELDTYLAVNCRVPLQLSHHFVSRWTARKHRAGIVLMSSLAGLRGTQLVAPYAASKAFAFNLAEALHFELKDFGIDVLGVCPGTMRTVPFLSSKPVAQPIQPPIQDPAEVAEEALNALGKKTLLIPGRYNRLVDRFLNWLPRRRAVQIMNDNMRKIYPHYWKPEG